MRAVFHCPGCLMSVLRTSIYLAGLIGAVAATDANAAPPAAGARLTLSAHADTYCGLAWNEKQIELTRRGAALIGRVTDGCNTRGYVVTAQFERLQGGTLVVADERFPIGEDGTVSIVSKIAQVRTASWRLEGAVFEAGYSSSPLRLSIAPL